MATTKKAAPKKVAASTDVPTETSQKEMQVTVTIDGREWLVNLAALNDFEVLDDLAAIDNGNPSLIPALLRAIVGNKQYSQVLDTLRDDTGRVSIPAGVEFFHKVFAELRPNFLSSLGS